jgi:hypothetical protein
MRFHEVNGIVFDAVDTGLLVAMAIVLFTWYVRLGLLIT